ncbi:Thiol-disulfide oxidoreductase ResA [Anatilimnocola aggregata]|uniref:Thiol-disulfide oxidoreductase ResA n=1 Tax=Anatilimnocola aggregata TaxID=2528021 RepID=A0A517YJI7_9BACT|nr:redoxin domain-containing protein [Anatilimnocola aggregata]QDU30389.1 Thiol-disulfide oxidoreductase ResA [Anatilimnocola aggregata]
MKRHLLAALFAAATFGICTAEDAAPKSTKAAPAKEKKVDIGTQAPAFKIKDAAGKEIELSALTAKGPVLVRLTCGCSGCDKELAYFQEINEAYKSQGLTSLLVFREPDEKVAKYAAEKKLDMLYAVDSKGTAWEAFETKAMPTNFLIEKGGKIISIAAGCEPNGLIANIVSKKAAKAIGVEAVSVGKDAKKVEKK